MNLQHKRACFLVQNSWTTKSLSTKCGKHVMLGFWSYYITALLTFPIAAPDRSHVCEVLFPIEQDVWSLLPSVFVPEFWSSRIQWKLQLFRPLFRIFSDSSFLLLLEAAQVWLLLPSVSPDILWQDLNNQFWWHALSPEGFPESHGLNPQSRKKPDIRKAVP